MGELNRDEAVQTRAVDLGILFLFGSKPLAASDPGVCGQRIPQRMYFAAQQDA